MTTDELRIALATALGWRSIGCTVDSYHGDTWPPSGYPPDEVAKPDNERERHGLPSLASLVAQAEKGLSDSQKTDYAGKIAGSFTMEQWTSRAFWFYLITAPTADRAKALLEVLRP